MQILEELAFKLFFFVASTLKIRSIREASSLRKPKSSNMIPQRKNFVKLVRKQYGNPDEHVFFGLK